MSDFESIGRNHLTNTIEALEESQPGWCPTFYFTGSYESDQAEAKRLREMLEDAGRRAE